MSLKKSKYFIQKAINFKEKELFFKNNRTILKIFSLENIETIFDQQSKEINEIIRNKQIQIKQIKNRLFQKVMRKFKNYDLKSWKNEKICSRCVKRIEFILKDISHNTTVVLKYLKQKNK